MLNRLVIASLITLLHVSGLSAESTNRESKFRFELEGASAWVSRNDVQIPNDNEGTRFAIDDLDNGPYGAWRASLEWDPSENHGFKLLLAPFQYSESGVFSEDIRFQNQIYTSGEEVRTSYQFNSYRLAYRYTFYRNQKWRLRGGITAKIRDAKIKVSNDNTASTKTDLGFVPLLNFRADYYINSEWSAIFDGEFLGASQGRAIDLALLARYSINETWDVSAGYRILDGGADNDEVYTFAQVHYALLQLGYTF